MYLTYEKERTFEDKWGWDYIRFANIEIGKKLGFTPKVEYSVCKEGACCYSPSSIAQFSYPHAQKEECERFLKEQRQKFPDGWVVKEGYETTRLEFYPQFHKDWNHLMEAIGRLKIMQSLEVEIDPLDIFLTWEKLLKQLESDCVCAT